MAIAATIALALAAQSAPAAAQPNASGEPVLENTGAVSAELSDLADVDPAQLINRGVALARTGHYDAARRHFEAARDHEERFELETVSGEWMDSRTLARKGLAMLDRGEFQRYFALSSR